MKSPALILFIIFNLLAINLVSASNMYDDKMTESHLVSAHDDNSTLVDSHDEAVCTHFCHISSHMVGFISQIKPPPVITAHVIYFTLNKRFQSFIHTPPSQPPKA